MMDISALVSVAMEISGKAKPVAWEQEFWRHIVTLGLRESLVLLAFGSVCIFYGWRIFRILVVICCAFIGMLLGMWVGAKAGSQLWGGVFGAILLAIVAFPLTKWAVCILGALAGGILTGGVWYALGLPSEYIWAGALVGVVAGGMISFIVFKISIMLFTCLAGVTMILAGILALFYMYQPSARTVQDLVLHNQWFLPAAIILPTIGAMFLQNKLISTGSSFSLES
jgi:hypothetical protein